MSNHTEPDLLRVCQIINMFGLEDDEEIHTEEVTLTVPARVYEEFRTAIAKTAARQTELKDVNKELLEALNVTLSALKMEHREYVRKMAKQGIYPYGKEYAEKILSRASK